MKDQKSVEALHLKYASNECWPTCYADGTLYFACDPHGFYQLTIDDQVVGCISLVRYDAMFIVCGYFILRPEYRQKGLGMAFLKNYFATNTRKDFCLALYAVMTKVSYYETLGFKEAFVVDACYGRRSVILRTEVDHPEEYKKNSCLVRAATRNDLSAIVAMDRRAFPSCRHAFFEKALHLINSAVDMFVLIVEGQLEGFVMLKKVIAESMPSVDFPCYKASPFYATSTASACYLLKQCMQQMVFDHHDSGDHDEILVSLWTPGSNENCKILRQLYGLECKESLMAMSTKNEVFMGPGLDHSILFSVASMEIG